MLAFLCAILPFFQITPVLAFLFVAWTYRMAMVRIYRGQPLWIDLLKAPIFFVSLDIAYNVGWFVVAVDIAPPSSLLEAIGRMVGITVHLCIAGWFVFVHRKVIEEVAGGGRG